MGPGHADNDFLRKQVPTAYKIPRVPFRIIHSSYGSQSLDMNKPRPVAEIFSQGDEIVTGQTVDTNAAWLSEQLVQAGFNVNRHTAVGDRLQSLVELLREISSRADCCICTGGLGPTVDDLTAEAVSLAFDRPLIRDADAVIQIEKHFIRMGRPMPSINLKQALLPREAQRIDNHWGTAPGFTLRADQCWFVFMPGVPFEMKNMFCEFVQPELAQNWPFKPMQLITLRSAGIGESSIQERLKSVRFPQNVSLSFRTGPLENQTKLLFQSDASFADVQAFVEKVARAIGRPVFGIDGLKQDCGDLVTVIGAQMLKNHQRLSVLETLSSGKITSRCGGACWFREGLVVRDKVQVFSRFSLPCPSKSDEKSLLNAASTLASVLAEKSAVDFAIAQLWDFDGSALEDMNAVLSVYTALATPTGIYQYTCQLSGTALRKQTTAATCALDMLRRYLQGFL